MLQAGDVAQLKGVILSRSSKQLLNLEQSAVAAGTPNKLLFDICPCEFDTVFDLLVQQGIRIDSMKNRYLLIRLLNIS